MSYDGVFTYGMVRELRESILQGKIEKIYQPQPEQLLLIIHTSKGKRKLFASASGSHSAVYFVDDTPENPFSPPVFCMVLRKHLNAARIIDVSQHENDRIIEITLETIDELGFDVNKKLIFEIMGKHSNIVLTDIKTGKIIECIKHVGIDVNRARQILPGKLYEYPPAQVKIPFSKVSESDIYEMIDGELQPERCLLNGIQGLSPVFAQSLTIDSTDKIDGSVSPVAVHDEIAQLTESIYRGKTSAVAYVKEGTPADFHLIPLSVYEEDESYEILNFDTLSKAAAFYFTSRESSNTIKQKSNDLQRVIKDRTDKLKLKKQRLLEDIKKAENADKYRLYGELLTANLHLCSPGSKSVTVVSYYDGSEVVIPLDPKYPAARNAQNYYRKYAKFKTASKEKQAQLSETATEIEYLDSVSSFADRAKSIEEIQLIRNELVESGYIRFHTGSKANRKYGAKKSKPHPYAYELSSGKAVLVGRNNKENDWLTFKRASSDDIWFHTKDIPGSHVILFNDETPVSEDDLFEAASIAAYHSKGSVSENVPVDYTRVKHVKKPSGSKPGFVIFTHNRTLYVNPKIPE